MAVDDDIPMYDSEQEASEAAKKMQLASDIPMYDTEEEALNAIPQQKSKMSQFLSSLVQKDVTPTPFQIGAQHSMKEVGANAQKNILDLLGYVEDKDLSGNARKKVEQLKNDPAFLKALQNSPFLTKTGSFVGGAIPFGLTSLIPGVGQAGWVARPLISSAAGALGSEHPKEGAVVGAVGDVASRALAPIGSAIANIWGKSGIKNAARQTWNAISPDKKMTSSNDEAFDTAVENYRNHQIREHDKWIDVKQQAAQADSNLDYDISNETHLKNLREYAKKIKGQQEHVDSNEYDASQKMLNKWINEAPHGGLEGMIEHNQALNHAYGLTADSGVKLPYSTVKYGIKSIKDTIEENIENNSELKDLGKDWRQANDLTKSRYKNYHEILDPKSEVASSSFTKFEDNILPNGKVKDVDLHDRRGNFINDYIPKSPNEGIQNMQKLGRMLGNESYAKSMIKKNLLGNAANEKEVVSIFNKLSEDQKNYLFTRNQKNVLNAMSSKLVKKDRIYTPPTGKMGVGSDVIGKSIVPSILSGSQQPISFYKSDTKNK